MKNAKIFALLALLFFLSCKKQDEVKTYAKWQTVTLDFEGMMTDEKAAENPFTDYRLNVTFSHKEKTLVVPGYYAADGKAGETSADSGNTWRVKFSPDKKGDWTYKVSFRKGKDLAINDDPKAGEAVDFDGEQGHFTVEDINSFYGGSEQGRLRYVGERYLKFEESGKYFLKGGPNSPENFLAYADFDGTYPSDSTKNFIKDYQAHVVDWKTEDPTWQNGKGKGIIGALNYIADHGMNTVYMLTMNIKGDGRDVWPYISHDQFDRFDCSKLDQWDMVFDHAQKLGIMLHFVLQETENETLLDDGDTGPHRKLYYRELIARFSHHLMITWNLGEENGYADFTPNAQNDQQRKDMATYIKQHDPYDNYLVIHTHAWEAARDPIVEPLYGFDQLDGLSLQIDKRKSVHKETIKYIENSEKAGRIWVSAMDEIGLYWMGAMPDTLDPAHDTIRQEVLWGHLMAGGPGVEWYFGYNFPPADLDCQDWRSREKLWDQTDVALNFFRKNLPFWEMKNHDELVDNETTYCFAKPGEIYAVYFKKQGSANLKVEKNNAYSIQWFDPKDGTEQLRTRAVIENGLLNLDWPFGFEDQDLVVLLIKE